MSAPNQPEMSTSSSTYNPTSGGPPPPMRKLGLASKLVAWLTVVSLILSFLFIAYAMLSHFTMSSLVMGGVGLLMVFLNYNIVAHAINCDAMGHKDLPYTSTKDWL